MFFISFSYAIATNTIKYASNSLQKEIEAFKNLDIEIYEGDFTIIMGASWAGKSTLLYSLSGMDKPTSGSIIILVLYLLMKTLIYKRRYEFGILKAVGYRSKDLIFQNVISFMPTIIIGTLIGTLISYFITNPYIGLMMRPFGIMKCTMVLPADLMIFTIVFMILISLFATVLMSLKIRKVEPTKLLVG